MNVDDFMTPNPETIGAKDTLAVAREKMERGRFRRLPVVDSDGTLLGILTDGDIREHIGYLPTTRVSAAMVENPVTVHVDTPLDVAAELMLERKIGGLPVVGADGKVVGIITETDVVRCLLRHVRGV